MRKLRVGAPRQEASGRCRFARRAPPAPSPSNRARTLLLSMRSGSLDGRSRCRFARRTTACDRYAIVRAWRLTGRGQSAPDKLAAPAAPLARSRPVANRSGLPNHGPERRGRDSNPRWTERPTTVFETRTRVLLTIPPRPWHCDPRLLLSPGSERAVRQIGSACSDMRSSRGERAALPLGGSAPSWSRSSARWPDEARSRACVPVAPRRCDPPAPGLQESTRRRSAAQRLS